MSDIRAEVQAERLREILQRIADTRPSGDLLCLVDRIRDLAREALAWPTPVDGEAGKWLPIETAPMDGQAVLGYVPTYYQLKGGCAVLIYYEDAWYDNGAFVTTPTHWMPLPEPPK